MKDLSNQYEFKVTANYSKRTYTIRIVYLKTKAVTKYRTYPISKEDFRSCGIRTPQDWRNAIGNNECYLVK